MKIIFLDVDGVLNHERTLDRAPGGFTGIDPVNLERFQRLLRETDARIVVSSTWRMFPELMAYLKQRLATDRWAGETPRLEILSTESLFVSPPRRDEIQAWLDQNPTERFVILDDGGGWGHLEPFVVRTRIEDGLTEEDVRKALKLLRPARGGE